jgi:uncharacterized membrane protein YhfC
MTHILPLITLIFSLLAHSLFAPQAQTPPSPSQAELEAAARAYIEQLASGQYEAATATFAPAMTSALPPARLKSIWDDLLTRYGALQSIDEAQISEVGEFTAVNVVVSFERAALVLRVVYNLQGQISGFFQYPTELKGQPSPAMLAALGFAAFVLLLGPLALGWLARRRLNVSWKYFWVGVAIFLVFQVFLRIPLVSIVQTALAAQIQSSTAAMLAWIAALSLSAGLVEEFGRYIAFRWLMANDPKTWKVVVMYGLGHGGIEAMVLAGFSSLSSLVLVLFWPQISGMLPATQAAPIAMQIAPLLGASAWLPLASVWERMCAMTLHVALSLLVLQVFRRGQMRWLWLAIGAHTLANLVVIGLVTVLALPQQGSLLLSSGLLLVMALLSLYAIYRLRE